MLTKVKSALKDFLCKHKSTTGFESLFFQKQSATSKSTNLDFFLQKGKLKIGGCCVNKEVV
jgi:hypothetical protein